MTTRISSCWKESRMPQGFRQRTGAVLVAALVCLAVVTGIFGSMLQGALLARRQLHVERNVRQVELLLQGGADLAAVRLANDSAYPGETWKISSEEITGVGNAEVTIGVARDTLSGPVQVRVAVEYPSGSDRSIRRSRTFVLPTVVFESEKTEESIK